MPKYRVDSIISRTYGTVVIEADTEDEARQKAWDLEVEEWDQGVEYAMDIIACYEED